MQSIRWIFVAGLFASVHGYSQYIPRVQLSAQEKNEQVIEKFEGNPIDKYNSHSIILYRNGTYFYEKNGDGGFWFSKGTWKRGRNLLILESEIKTDSLPVSISYPDSATSNYFLALGIEVAVNAKKEPLADALVLVNNDSIQCTPLMGTCYGSFSKIERIKIALPNGFTSRWLNITNKKFVTLLPVINVDYDILHYMDFDQKIFRMKNGGISEVK